MQGGSLISANNGKSYWERQAEDAKLPLSERLRKQADAERSMAKQFDGCSWLGDVHPSTPHLDRASLLEQAARMAEAEELRQAKKKPNVDKPTDSNPDTGSTVAAFALPDLDLGIGAEALTSFLEGAAGLAGGALEATGEVIGGVLGGLGDLN